MKVDDLDGVKGEELRSLPEWCWETLFPKPERRRCRRHRVWCLEMQMARSVRLVDESVSLGDTRFPVCDG